MRSASNDRLRRQLHLPVQRGADLPVYALCHALGVNQAHDHDLVLAGLVRSGGIQGKPDTLRSHGFYAGQPFDKNILNARRVEHVRRRVQSNAHCHGRSLCASGGLSAVLARDYTGKVPKVPALNLLRASRVNQDSCCESVAAAELVSNEPSAHTQHRAPGPSSLAMPVGYRAGEALCVSRRGNKSWVQYRSNRASGRLRALPLVAVNSTILGSRFWCKSASLGRRKRQSGSRTSPAAAFALAIAGLPVVRNQAHRKSSLSFQPCATNTRRAAGCFNSSNSIFRESRHGRLDRSLSATPVKGEREPLVTMAYLRAGASLDRSAA